jgi:hypothetical protein
MPLTDEKQRKSLWLNATVFEAVRYELYRKVRATITGLRAD